ncbi:phosphoribosylformylglycinamidine cyclo-ligase [Blastopirellula retiformator]|uniref:Phosphoribosylformylglycinamidine cyclo-ligase n=1 Tax=Blastopirellula retiformator TaxID=2527970 RepID=A0A5C5UUF9_9BACT|nr:phosphoribosylformylglycinamidine cyclo-ligase [Blastopirellula retiformator]TWT29946.1 Phosphoribosylformylglycinamidine cyclo-ligase [Blastopirellula retiformator]
MAKATYKEAGVDLDVYAESMSRLPRLVHRTHSPRVMKLDGGFAGLFKLDFDNPLFARKYENPVLISCTDGVGTKLKIAEKTGFYKTVGIDLVAMCVNDAICCGAEPLFFLDYIAMGKDDPDLLEDLVEGITDGCLQGDCALVGGETAIMPDIYQVGDYDMAGFCVGVAEQAHLIDGSAISAGDKVIGIASSGVHSNGFSLVRKVVFELAQLTVDQHVEELGETVGDALLRPTKIYVAPVRKVLNHYKVKNVVHGIAHITGGGLTENIERILPKNVDVKIDGQSWPRPAVFPWLQELGEIEEAEMARVFNMGIGLTMIVSSYYANSVKSMIADCGFETFEIGEVVEGSGKVTVS